MKLAKIIELSDENLAEHLDDSLLDRIGEDAIQGYEDDLESRKEWEEKNADALKLALQYFENKTFPWPNASNVKYPLVLVSCIQFNSRAYPAMIPGDRVCEIKTSPAMDTDVTKVARAVADDMNWGIMSGEWEEGHDLLLMMLPLIGTVFKKTYYDPDLGGNVSFPIHPSNFVVDYWAKSLDTCERKTHVQRFRDNQVREKINLGLYRDQEYGKRDESLSKTEKASDAAKGFQEPAEQDTYAFLEQCCWIDLDKDGYKEPYIVTVDRSSGKVARLVDNFHTITLVDRGTRLTITPEEYSDDLSFMKVGRISENQYYTKYGFIRSPDGSFYDVGLGQLLSPINHAADSLINILIDTGVLNSAGGGLLSRNIRIRSGNISRSPGLWHRTDASAEELKSGVFPWPVHEPSNVLFQLLGMLLDAGQKIGSVSDTMMGKNPGQNQAATTTMTVLEQGLQVFSAIYKRVFRSMSEEFRKWYTLNKRYGESPEMYQFDVRLVRPTADPSAVAQAQRMLKAEALMARTQAAPHLYGMEGAVMAEQRYLEALGIPNPAEMLKDAQPPQNPEAEIEKQKIEIEQQRWMEEHKIAVAKETREQERAKSSIMKDMTTVQTKMASASLNEEKQAWQEYMDRLQMELEMIDKSIEMKRVQIEQRRMERESSNQRAAETA